MVDRHDWNKEIKGCDLLDKSLKTYKVWVDQNGADGNFTKMTTPKFDQRTFVLFYLVDCKENIAKLPDTRNRFTGTVSMHNDKSHFADNESYYMTFIIVFGLAYSLLAFYMFRDFLYKCRRSEEINRVYLMVNIS